MFQRKQGLNLSLTSVALNHISRWSTRAEHDHMKYMINNLMFLRISSKPNRCKYFIVEDQAGTFNGYIFLDLSPTKQMEKKRRKTVDELIILPTHNRESLDKNSATSFTPAFEVLKSVPSKTCSLDSLLEL